MPPKAKESKPAAPDPDAAAAEQKALVESELVTALLRTRLGRYQAAGEKLAVENFTLSDELAKQKLTLADINEFLTNELKARSLAAAQLEERVAQLSTRLAEVQKESQAEIARVKAEAAAEVAAASARAAAAVSAAGGDGAADGSPADAAGQKAQLERTIAELTSTLTARQKDFDARISDMERRHLQEKEKMRKEAATKIRETKVAMAQLADQHLESSTKRTLVENETMVAELAYHTAQSHELVAANTMLRNETAELRRQLAIAHKTVQSTARKNLLLQQTIKSILTCLREEARQNAEAAIAAHQEHHSYACAAVCDSPTAGVQPHSACMQAYAQAHMHLGEQHHWQQQHGYQSQHECADSYQQQQQQDAAGDADAVLQQLEARVLQLSDELVAAKQAMAAALQGCLPEDLQAPCTITISNQHIAAVSTSTAAAAAVSVPEGKDHKQQKQRRQNAQQQGQQQVAAAGAGAQQGPMEAALEDGVAAFVLYCVQQLRRGGALTNSSTTSPSRQQMAGANARPDCSSNSSGKGAGRQSVSRGRGSRSVSPATGTRAAAAAAAGGSGGGSKGGNPPAAAAAAAIAGSDGMSQLAVPAASAAVAAEDGCDGVWGSREVVGATSNAEQLARLLLEQLHSYLRHNLAPYDGLGLDFGEEPQQLQQHQQGGVGVHGDHHAGAAAEQVGQWPAAALQVQSVGQLTAPAAAAAAAGPGAGGCLSPGAGLQQAMGVAKEFGGGLGCAEECSTGLQLPPLPCLLNNMGRNSGLVGPGPQAGSLVAGAPAAAAAAGGGGGGKGGRSKSPGRSADREGLFSAVLSELRPWGPTVGPAGSSSSGTAASGGAAAAGALVGPSRAGAAGAGGHGVFSRSKTPTSPGVGVMRNHSPVSSPSSWVAASRPAGQH